MRPSTVSTRLMPNQKRARATSQIHLSSRPMIGRAKIRSTMNATALRTHPRIDSMVSTTAATTSTTTSHTRQTAVVTHVHATHTTFETQYHATQSHETTSHAHEHGHHVQQSRWYDAQLL